MTFLCCASEPAGLASRTAPPSPHWNKGSSESGHPMTSLRPTLIHIFIYLVHTSTTHRYTPVHFHSSPCKRVHRTVWSIFHRGSPANHHHHHHLFVSCLSCAALQHLSGVKTKRQSVVQKSWVDRKRGAAEVYRFRCPLRCAETEV